jgi:hypothetical protein
VLVPGEVEGRPALHGEGHRTTHDLNAPHQPVAPPLAVTDTHRHVVHDLAHAARRQEARDQDVRIGPVVLLGGHVRDIARADLEVAALLLVEDRREDARRVEMWVAEPVDRSVHPDQGRAVHVADNAVVLNGLVRHIRVLKSCPGRSAPFANLEALPKGGRTI